VLEEYKYLSDCNTPYNSDKVFEVAYNNKTFLTVSTKESAIYKISISIYKKI